MIIVNIRKNHPEAEQKPRYPKISRVIRNEEKTNERLNEQWRTDRESIPNEELIRNNNSNTHRRNGGRGRPIKDSKISDIDSEQIIPNVVDSKIRIR